MGECLIIRSGGGTDTSDATATSEVILSGYSCYVNDELVTGSMVAQNPGNQSLTPGGEYTIAEGYYDGTDEISVTSLSENTSATATADYILTGYTAWVNGSSVSGSMANRGNVSQSLGVNGSYTIPVGWHAGSGRVTQSLATQGGTTVTPSTSNITACPANRWTTGSIIILGSSNLSAGNIKNGVTIFGVRGTFSGWVTSHTYSVGNDSGGPKRLKYTLDHSFICLWNGSSWGGSQWAPWGDWMNSGYTHIVISANVTYTVMDWWCMVKITSSMGGLTGSGSSVDIYQHHYATYTLGFDQSRAVNVPIQMDVTNYLPSNTKRTYVALSLIATKWSNTALTPSISWSASNIYIAFVKP